MCLFVLSKQYDLSSKSFWSMSTHQTYLFCTMIAKYRNYNIKSFATVDWHLLKNHQCRFLPEASFSFEFCLCLPLQWRHNGCDDVSNHQHHDCLLNRLFGRRKNKHQSSASLAFVRGVHRSPMNFPHNWPVTRKMVPFDDVIMRPYACVRACVNLELVRTITHLFKLGSSNLEQRCKTPWLRTLLFWSLFKFDL